MGHHSRKLVRQGSDRPSSQGAADFLKQNRQYWEDPQTVSLLDKNLRRLEEKLVLSPPEAGIFPGGCRLRGSHFNHPLCAKGEALHGHRAIGLPVLPGGTADPPLRGLKTSGTRTGTCLTCHGTGDTFDAVVTQRVLINLPDWRHQMAAIRQIHASLRTGGTYLMIENTYEGHELLNRARRAVGLKEIPIHWHNVFFHQDRLFTHLRRLFVLEEHHTFDVYYLLTRVFGNMFAHFEGFGRHATKDPVFDTIDKAAAKLYEKAGQTMKLGGAYAFGPIQGFVLRKRSA